MKLTALERISVAVTALAFLVMAVFFAGAQWGQSERITLTPGVRDEGAGQQDRLAPAEDSPPEEEITLLLNINTATAQQLQALPGIGAVRAQAIVDYRTEHGPFRYVEQLREVSGIGEGTLEKILDYVTVGS